MLSAIVGFGIVVAGVVQMYLGKTTPALASLGSGIISEFVAAVFFYLYNNTVIKMADYHRKLVLTQNVSLALRITQDLPDDARVEAQRQLVDRLTMDVNKFLSTGATDPAPRSRSKKSQQA